MANAAIAATTPPAASAMRRVDRLIDEASRGVRADVGVPLDIPREAEEGEEDAQEESGRGGNPGSVEGAVPGTGSG